MLKWHSKAFWQKKNIKNEPCNNTSSFQDQSLLSGPYLTSELAPDIPWFHFFGQLSSLVFVCFVFLILFYSYLSFLLSFSFTQIFLTNRSCSGTAICCSSESVSAHRGEQAFFRYSHLSGFGSKMKVHSSVKILLFGFPGMGEKTGRSGCDKENLVKFNHLPISAKEAKFVFGCEVVSHPGFSIDSPRSSLLTRRLEADHPDNIVFLVRFHNPRMVFSGSNLQRADVGFFRLTWANRIGGVMTS